MCGLFITLEGIDGSGKTTQAERLVAALGERGVGCLLTRQPGGTLIGQQVRGILLANTSAGLSPMAELMLYAADRAQHVAELIRPALAAGRVVICDRYTDSTVAFQGYGRGLDLVVIDQLNRLATGGLMPDLTIVFDLEPELAQARLKARLKADEGESGMTRFEEEAREFHERVRAGYLRLAETYPERVRLLDASGSPEAAHQQAMRLLVPLLDFGG